jgi:hypothetical protein
MQVPRPFMIGERPHAAFPPDPGMTGLGIGISSGFHPGTILPQLCHRRPGRVGHQPTLGGGIDAGGGGEHRRRHRRQGPVAQGVGGAREAIQLF